MDVWEYIKIEHLAVPTIYFSHERECFRRGGQWLPVPPMPAGGKPDPYAGARPKAAEQIRTLVVRVRTIADMISTGMIESPADSVDDIIGEVSAARRQPRGIEWRSTRCGSQESTRATGALELGTRHEAQGRTGHLRSCSLGWYSQGRRFEIR